MTHLAPGYRDGVASLEGRPRLVEEEPDEPTTLPGPMCLADVTAEALAFEVDGLVVKGEPNAVVGDGDAGKSSFQYAVAAAKAGNALALNTFGLQPGSVLMISGEDGRGVIRNRIEAIARGHHLDPAAVLRNVYLYDEDVDIDDPRWQLRLEDAARDVGATLATFDPLVDLCGAGVEENSNSDAKRVTKWLRRFIRRTGCTPWISMHVSKPSEGRTDRKHRVRGASAWRNAVRMCWWLEPCDGGFELDPIKANRLARPKVLRVKRTIVADANRPMMWKAAHFALDTDGEMVQRSVIAVLAHVADCKAPPSQRDIEGAAEIHKASRDSVRAAIAVAKSKGWIVTEDGPRRSLLHTVTEAGRARLALAHD